MVHRDNRILLGGKNEWTINKSWLHFVDTMPNMGNWSQGVNLIPVV